MTEEKIQFIEASEAELRRNIQQTQSLIILLETVGSEHPQYSQLAFLNKNLQESTEKLNQLNTIKNKLRDEI